MQNADFKDTQRELSQLQKKISELWNAIGIDKLREKLAELESDIQKNEVWSVKERFAEINQEISRLKRKTDPWAKLKNDTDEALGLLEMAEAEGDESIINEVASIVKHLSVVFDQLETRELLSENDDVRDAFCKLSKLRGREHKVITAVCVMDAERGLCEVQDEVTRVCFRDITDEEIRAYIMTGEPMDKAGAYGIQGLGAVFIDRIEGCYFNVVGLPLKNLYSMLQRQGVRLLER